MPVSPYGILQQIRVTVNISLFEETGTPLLLPDIVGGIDSFGTPIEHGYIYILSSGSVRTILFDFVNFSPQMTSLELYFRPKLEAGTASVSEYEIILPLGSIILII